MQKSTISNLLHQKFDAKMSLQLIFAEFAKEKTKDEEWKTWDIDFLFN